MTPNRSTVQFILIKLIACYLAMSLITLGVFSLWQYYQVREQRQHEFHHAERIISSWLATDNASVGVSTTQLPLLLQSISSSNISLIGAKVYDKSEQPLYSWSSQTATGFLNEGVREKTSLKSMILDGNDNVLSLELIFPSLTSAWVAQEFLMPIAWVLIGQLSLLLLIVKVLINRGLRSAFDGFMRELKLVNLRNPSPLQAQSELGQFVEYRQILDGVNRVILSLAKSRSELADVNLALEHKIEEKTAALKERNEELVSLNRQLSIIANTDSLTQVYNRTRFDVLFQEYVVLAHRRSTPLSILLVDLDDFKKVNDNYGHQVGDHVLKHAAQVIQKTVADQGVVARWGGEEFAVLLSYFNLEAAETMAENIRSAIASATFEKQVIRITTSIGVAQLSRGEPGAHLLKRADDALYNAKGSGRNRVIIAYAADAAQQQLEIESLAEGEFKEVLDADSKPSLCVSALSQKLPS